MAQLKPRIDHQQVQERHSHKNRLKIIINLKMNYLIDVIITKPANRISLTRLRLGCHALRIQTGKFENREALKPVIK